jgi:hypothetical protein
MLGNRDVTQDVALTSQSKTRVGVMGRKAKAAELCRGRIRDQTFDANCARSASAVTATVDRACNSRVEGKAGPQKNNAEIRSLRAVNRLASEVNGGQVLSSCRLTD